MARLLNKFKDFAISLLEVEEQCKHDDVYHIHVFEQTWPSTCLGFGGIGGQSFTDAVTVVVETRDTIKVFFGSRFAYAVKCNKEYRYKECAVNDLLIYHNAASCLESSKYQWPKEEQIN